MPWHHPGLSLLKARGDPQLAGALLRLAPIAGRAIARTAGRLLKAGGRAGGAAVAVSTGIAGGRAVHVAVQRPPAGRIAAPGMKARVQRLIPGGATGFRKRPTMRVTNVKALRRAMRRVEGFAALAKKTIAFTKQVRMKPPKKRR